jgi:hypothetical protein
MAKNVGMIFQILFQAFDLAFQYHRVGFVLVRLEIDALDASFAALRTRWPNTVALSVEQDKQII